MLILTLKHNNFIGYILIILFQQTLLTKMLILVISIQAAGMKNIASLCVSRISRISDLVKFDEPFYRLKIYC